MIIHNNATASVLIGDCLESMRQLPDSWIQTCVTSPPYFGLRDYGHDGQIGLEPTPAEFVAKLVEVFREVRRVLRDDGTLWLNLGDSYAGSWGARGRSAGTSAARPDLEDKHGTDAPNRHGFAPWGVKPKDLIGIPWRVAFALQADGWYLRQEIIWHKPNPMPESVTDRCTKAHEHLFLLAKSERYLCDMDAIKEPAVGANAHDLTGRTKQRGMADTFKRAGSKRVQVIPGQTVGTHREDRAESEYDLATRNRRSVWTVATRPYKGAHFATFPPALIEPCILAGSRAGDFVLDPFGGSGTTAGVALKHGRHAMLCELNADYADLISARVASIAKDSK
jgi:DNA modification methylase